MLLNLPANQPIAATSRAIGQLTDLVPVTSLAAERFVNRMNRTATTRACRRPPDYSMLRTKLQEANCLRFSSLLLSSISHLLKYSPEAHILCSLYAANKIHLPTETAIDHESTTLEEIKSVTVIHY